MTLRGGLVAIIRTDVISFLLVCLIFPLFLIFTKNHASNPLPDLPHLLPTRFVISLIILTMFTYILAPWYGQKIFSAKAVNMADNIDLSYIDPTDVKNITDLGLIISDEILYYPYKS